jgi:hypothetical protein
VSVFVPAACCFCYYDSTVVWSQVFKTSSIVLFAWNYFGYLGSFVLPNKFYDYFSLSVKNTLGILLGNTLNTHIAFDNIAIFIILILLIHKHGLSIF